MKPRVSEARAPSCVPASWRPLRSHAPVQPSALPQVPGQDPSGSFLQGWAGTGEGGPPNLPCQQSAFSSAHSTGEGLAAACFSSSSPFPPSASHRSRPVPALLLIPASCLCLPPSSPLQFPAKLQRAGQQAGAGGEDSDKTQLLAALSSSESGP